MCYTPTHIVYDLQAVGPDGEKQYFRKPWMMTLVMFVGMTFCLPLAKAKEAAARRAAKQRNALDQPLLGDPAEVGSCEYTCVHV